MKTNMLDYMYEGYGYDMDNQLLYTDVEKYDEALDKDGYSDNGMKTFSSEDIGITGYEERIPTEDANEYKEVPQFISENGANYTDFRQQICKCGGNGTFSWAYNDESTTTDDDAQSDEPTVVESGDTTNTSDDAESGDTASNDTESGDTNNNG